MLFVSFATGTRRAYSSCFSYSIWYARRGWRLALGWPSGHDLVARKWTGSPSQGLRNPDIFNGGSAAATAETLPKSQI